MPRGDVRSVKAGQPVVLVPGQGISTTCVLGWGPMAAPARQVGFRAVTRLTQSMDVVATIASPGCQAMRRPIAVDEDLATAGLGSGGGGTVYRIDPQTNRVIATIHVGDGPAFGVAAQAGAWSCP